MQNTYAVNPLDTNVVFQIGEPVMLILIILSVVAAFLGFLGRVFGVAALDVQGSKWMNRFVVALLHVGLVWLGLTMLISYFGSSIVDVINGAILLIGAVTALVQRSTSDQRAANRTLGFTYGFLFFVFLWNFVYGSVMHNLPAQFLSAIGYQLQPDFFIHLFKEWGWG